HTKALAFWMTIKNALMGLPYGGAKGSILINPKEFEKEELEILSREFVRQLKNDIGPEKDIPAPDVYTNPEIMGWMMDEFNKINGKQSPSVVTGKPEIIGGNKAREYATSKGAYYVLREALDVFGYKSTGLSVAIHGFGNAGQNIAKILGFEEQKIIAVSDSTAAIYNEAGIDIDKLIEYKEKYSTVKGFDKEIKHEELLAIETNILCLAALSNTITTKNANKIKTDFIVELANGPVSIEAEKSLTKRGINILPDILANAGGVTVSYFEWFLGLSGQKWSEEKTNKKLHKKMKEAFYDCYKLMKENDIDLRTAAYMKAVRRLQLAEKARGRINY
ncbi:MAG: Glu/Leu/Phe/Val family dehydrogenase, partial [Nanobdellota archaeon]